MGLDIDVVKFDKTDFDSVCLVVESGQRWVDYPDGKEKYTELVYYRKAYVIRDILIELCDGRDQCTFHELTREKLVKSRDLAVAAAPKAEGRDIEDYAKWIRDCDKILVETDFEKEVVCLCWIS